MPDLHIDEKTKLLLKEQFDRLKHRDTLGIPSSEIVDFHGSFAKKFRFAVPIHARNLAQMIHPYWGYLAFFTDRHFRFEELVEVYENQIAASFERTSGRDLLANELSCLAFWNVNYSQKSSLSWSEMQTLLTSFRFKIQNEDQFKSEFSFLLNENKGEIRTD